MTKRHNPLQALLNRGGNGDDWKDVLLVVAIHEREPQARGRAPGWHRSGSCRELVYSGSVPDLSTVPPAMKVIILDSQAEGE